MKVKVEKIQTGLTRFIDTEMMPSLEGWSKIGFGAASVLIIKNLPNTIAVYASNPVIEAMGVFDKDGSVDIDLLHDAVCDYFTKEGEYVTLPIVGRVKVTRQDIETLYKHIKEG